MNIPEAQFAEWEKPVDPKAVEYHFFSQLYPTLFPPDPFADFKKEPSSLSRLPGSFREEQSGEADLPVCQERPFPIISYLVRAQRIAKKLHLDCLFDSDESVCAAMESFPLNTRAILRMCLGIGGPIEWVTCDAPWAHPDQMPNHLAQQCLWTSSDPDSYGCESMDCQILEQSTSCSASSLEYNFDLLLERLEDPSLPVVLQVSFRGKTPRETRVVLDMHRALVKQMIHFSAPFYAKQDGRDFHLWVPLRDYFYFYEEEYPERILTRDEEALSQFFPGQRTEIPKETPMDRLADLIAYLERVGNGGEEGSSRFSCVGRLMAPQAIVTRGRGRGRERKDSFTQIHRHQCVLSPQKVRPTFFQVASFFEVTETQVREALGRFFNL